VLDGRLRLDCSLRISKRGGSPRCVDSVHLLDPPGLQELPSRKRDSGPARWALTTTSGAGRVGKGLGLGLGLGLELGLKRADERGRLWSWVATIRATRWLLRKHDVAPRDGVLVLFSLTGMLDIWWTRW